eukprot:g6327.t1
MFNVVQCFKCEQFQLVQRKSDKRSANVSWRSRGGQGLGSAKFTCKVCNSKQSERRIFGSSTSGKEARKMVMSLNQGRATAERDRMREELRAVRERVAEREREEQAIAEEAWRAARRHRALYAYDASAADELSFAAGDTILLLAERSQLFPEDGWCRGVHEASGSEGMFPECYVVKAEEHAGHEEHAEHAEAARGAVGAGNGACAAANAGVTEGCAGTTECDAGGATSAASAWAGLLAAPPPPAEHEQDEAQQQHKQRQQPLWLQEENRQPHVTAAGARVGCGGAADDGTGARRVHEGSESHSDSLSLLKLLRPTASVVLTAAGDRRGEHTAAEHNFANPAACEQRQPKRRRVFS